MNKVEQMVKVLTDNGYECKEIDRKEFARLANMFPDSAFVAGDSNHTVYALDTIDSYKPDRKICLYTVLRTD